jgi:hypothetical protein
MKTIKNLILTALAATSLLLTATTRADEEHSDATINWTKHVTAFLPPGGDIFGTIAGVASGDLGEATLVGDAFNPVQVVPGGITFEAEYRFVGAKHSLTMRFRVVQAPDRSGVMNGVVTDGWLKGHVMTGHYTARTCDEGVNHFCFDGTFLIKKSEKAD